MMTTIAFTFRQTAPKRLFLAAALTALSFPVVDAWCAPLDKAACAKVAQDMQNLKALDVDKLMENGPSWAVSHLSPADMSLVRQYIDLDEQMKFRCSAPGSLVHLKHLEDEDDETAAKPPAEVADTSAAKANAAAKADAGSPPSPPKAVKAAKKPKQSAQDGAGDGR